LTRLLYFRRGDILLLKKRFPKYLIVLDITMDPIIFAQLNEAYHKGVYSPEETLSEEEYLDIQEWVEALIEEGYDLDEYSDEELYEAYLVDLEEGYKKLPVDRMIAKSRQLSKLPKAPGEPRWGKNDERASFIRKTAGTHNASKVKKVEQQNRKRGENKDIQQENLDLYDLVSEYLISEGFCDSYEDAGVIMANMSEEWREGIVKSATKYALKKP
jgi:hypothetical protein